MNKVVLESFKPYRKVHWNPDPIMDRLRESEVVDLDNLDEDELKLLIKELDRRFVQLWEKVTYEREKGYVKYPK